MNKSNLLCLLVSLVLMLGATEMACRVLGVGDPRIAQWIVPKPRMDGEHFVGLKPNSKLVYRYPDNPRGYFDKNNEVVGRANAFGFRGDDMRLAKSSEKTLRVAILGDSFTEGYGVKDEDTFPKKLEVILKSEGHDIEILNFGVGGLNTVQEVDLMKGFVLKFKPDVILLMMFLNDTDRMGTVNFMSRAYYFKSLRKHSYFINGLMDSFEKKMLHHKMVEHYLDGYSKASNAWKKAKDAIIDAQYAAKDHNAEFVLGLYPALIDLDHDYPFRSIHDTVHNFSSQQQIQFVDLLKAFEGHQDKKLWVHRTDQHPNEIAQEIAAKFLADYFKIRFLKKI